jgi:archaellum component FlaC
MARIDELQIIEDEIRDCKSSIFRIKKEIGMLESNKSIEILRRNFLDENQQEISLIISRFKDKIEKLERIRDDFYSKFGKDSEKVLKNLRFTKKFLIINKSQIEKKY